MKKSHTTYTEFRFKLILIPLLAFILAQGTSLKAQTVAGKEAKKIGLVFSGGGAKGFAHIGVLKVLERAGIKADYICGTSMGALIGGLYASGYTASEIEEIALSRNWNQLFSDTTPRNSYVIDTRLHHERYFASFPIEDGRVLLPRGVVNGQNITTMLARLTAHVQHIEDFNKLPIPYRCIATDLKTGEAVVLDHGSLHEAMRASMSIPSVFTPIKLEGRTLIDGGVSINFPVSELRSMGADYIIGVDVGSILNEDEHLKTAPEIMEQSFTIYAQKSNNEQRLLADIVIDPDVRGISTGDFDKVEEIILKGELAALPLLHKLKEASKINKKPPAKSYSYVKHSTNQRFAIRKITFSNIEGMSKTIALQKLNIEKGKSVSISDIEEGVTRLYGTKRFERVSYRLKSHPEGNELIITTVEKKRDSFNIGFRYDTDLKAAILFNLNYSNLFIPQSTLNLDALLGDFPELRINYMRPGFILPAIGWEIEGLHRSFNFYHFIENKKISDYRAWLNKGKIGLRTLSFHNFQLGIGTEVEHVIYDTSVYNSYTDIEVMKIYYYETYHYLHYDTLNKTTFPTKGIDIYAKGKTIQEFKMFNSNSEKVDPAYRLYISGKWYIPLNNEISFFTKGFIGAVFGETLPFDYYYYLGGQTQIEDRIFPHLGINYMEARGRFVQNAESGVQFKVGDIFYLLPRFAILRHQLKESDLTDHSSDSFIFSYGVTGGMLTPLGALKSTVSTNSEQEELLFHISAGFQF